jgi:HlyD family secretion protein
MGNPVAVQENQGQVGVQKGSQWGAPPPASAKKMKKSQKKTVLVILAAVVLIALVVGGIVWSKRGVVVVQTGKVVRQDLSSLVTASGQIKPPDANLVNVNANSYGFGKITEVLVKEGDRVKKGQLLMRTEDRQQTAGVDAQRAAVKNSEADLSAQQADVQSAAAALHTAEANLAQAQAKLKQSKENFARGEQLFKDQLIAKQEFDSRLSDYDVAQATVQSNEALLAQAKAQYQSALYNRDMAVARISQSKAQLLGLQNQLDQTVYVSPIDGVVTSLPVTVGENMVPGIQNAVGSLLFQVADMSVITAEVLVDETDIVNVKLGQPAQVTIDAIPNKTFAGKVTQIGQSAVSSTTGQTTTTTQTGTNTQEAKDFKVVVTLDNPPPNLRPGLSCTAKVTTATRQNAVAIPIQALTIRTRRELEESQNTKGKALAATRSMANPSPQEQERLKQEVQGVFVVRGGQAAFVPLETGILGETNVEVLKGLQPGDEIVTGSFQVLRTLKPDTKVRVDNSAPAPVASASSS